MSLDNSNEWKVNPTEEERRRNLGEKLNDDDKDLIELKTTLYGYFSKIDSFLRKQMDNASVRSPEIGKMVARLSRQKEEIPSAYNAGNLKRRIDNEIFSELLEDGIPLLKQAYIDKFNETIARLQKRLESNTNPDAILDLERNIENMNLCKESIESREFENLSSYIYGIETFDMLDDKRSLDERKSRLEVALIKIEEDKDEIKSNTNLPREYKIEVVRQYLSIIKSYENALDALSA